MSYSTLVRKMMEFRAALVWLPSRLRPPCVVLKLNLNIVYDIILQNIPILDLVFIYSWFLNMINVNASMDPTAQLEILR